MKNKMKACKIATCLVIFVLALFKSASGNMAAAEVIKLINY